ncbi:MAG: helix-turn-helix transcriptional regulator [Eggerthellaceae bacterium]|nr:helix-turn-helix transcriptional regulator [Eggerthellaceae bacterium]
MANAVHLSIISRTISEIPGIGLASLGFGCALLAIEGNRMSTIQTVVLQGHALNVASLCAAAIMIILLIFYKRFGLPERLPSFILVVIGALLSVTLFIYFQQSILRGNEVLSFIVHILYWLEEGFILFIWMKNIFVFGAARCVVILGFATLIMAGINIIIILLKDDAAYTVVSLLPIISVLLLCYFRDFVRSHQTRKLIIKSEDEAIEYSPYVEPSAPITLEYPDRSLIVPSDKITSGRRIFLITLLLSLFCYAVIFGLIHYGWLILQDEGYISLVIQLGTAVGTALAGVAILVLVQYFWNRRSIELCKLLLIPLVLLALLISSYVTTSWIFVYLVILNLTQKLVFLLITLAPFIIASKKPYLMPWCYAYMAFTLGKAASSILLEHMSTDIFIYSSVIALVALFICECITSFSGSMTDYQAPLPETSDSQQETAVDSETRSANKLKKACKTVAEEYGLTGREEEILVLLARGRTASYIAETLFITQSTAKTHLRNIYSKMGVHAQQEVIDLVESTIDEQKSNPK